MYLDINKIGEADVKVEPELDFSGLTGDSGLPLKPRDVSMRAIARREVVDVYLRGRFSATVLLQCVRCLERFDESISSDFSLTLVREEIDFPSGETELEIQDITLFHCPEGKADLDAIAQEQLYLGLPLKPVCAPDCKGLCATCGANRNRIECACCRDTVDPRLASLRALQERMDKE